MIQESCIRFCDEDGDSIVLFEFLDFPHFKESLSADEWRNDIHQLKYIVMPSSDVQDEFIKLMHQVGAEYQCDLDLPKTDMKDGVIYRHNEKWDIIPPSELQEVKQKMMSGEHIDSNCEIINDLIDLKEHLRKNLNLI